MACINVTSIIVKNNPAPLNSPFCFLITFEALTNLNEDVEWRIIYIGDTPSANNSNSDPDQFAETKPPEEIELDCVALGPIKQGVLTFEFAVRPPDFQKMDPDSILGMQAVLVTASYKKNEFIRIGYFLNNMYIDPALRGDPPIQPIPEKMIRCIIDDMPRVTRYPIHWDEVNQELIQPEIVNTETMSGTQNTSKVDESQNIEKDHNLQFSLYQGGSDSLQNCGTLSINSKEISDTKLPSEQTEDVEMMA